MTKDMELLFQNEVKIQARNYHSLQNTSLTDYLKASMYYSAPTFEEKGVYSFANRSLSVGL